jgi:hypothetical protein
MRVQSIRTAIEPRHPASDRFLRPPIQVSCREVDGVAEAHDLAQKVRSMAEALKDARHLLASRLCPPLLIDLRHLTGSIGILYQVDLFRGFRHEFRDVFSP